MKIKNGSFSFSDLKNSEGKHINESYDGITKRLMEKYKPNQAFSSLEAISKKKDQKRVD